MQVTLELLLRRIYEAAAWCQPRADRADAARCLRTLPYNLHPFSSRYFLVEDVARERARRLGTWTVDWNTRDSAPPIAARDLQGGKVLAFVPDLYLYEGLETDECDGFLDINARPPTDTWLVYIDDVPETPGGALLSWVPEPFVEPVKGAIAVNPSDALKWFEELPGILASQYRRRPVH